jgi:NADH dehydrogenase [ubiquinone] 1 alpha subcomplex assembly factor 1
MLSNPTLLFDFDTSCELLRWMVVDDVVMGGRSDGHLEINEEGHGVFYGNVSLANSGGFSSVRYRFNQMKVDGRTAILVRLKGDGKRYQFRVKSSRSDRHSYITYLQTSGDWQEVEIPLDELSPSFRGRPLDMPNFNSEVMEEMAFLIANKKNEKFNLEIDYIAIK